jgi:hypothetical protein
MRSLLVLGLAFSSLTYAQRAVELEARYWFADSNHRIDLKKSGIGSEIRLKEDLGVKDEKIPGFRLDYRGKGGSSVLFDFFQIEQKGDQNVTRTVSYNGQTYSVGTRVTSALKSRNVRLGYAYRFGNEKFRMGPAIVGTGVWLKGALAAPAINTSSSGDISLGFPVVGLSFYAAPDKHVSISGNFGGIKVGSHGSATDGEIQLKVYPGKAGSFGVGFRSLRYGPKNNPDSAVLRFQGAFVSAGVRF